MAKRRAAAPSTPSASPAPWLDPHARCVFVAWDLETTGPDPTVDQIVQLGAMRQGEAFQTLVRPSHAKMTAGAQATHGIPASRLSCEPFFPEAWRAFLAFLQRGLAEAEAEAEAEGGGGLHLVLVGHNSWVFDDAVVAAELRGAGLLGSLAALAAARPGGVAVWSADTLPAARAARACGELQSAGARLGLGAVFEFYERRALDGAHDALADARAVFAVAPRLRRHLPCRAFVAEAAAALDRRLEQKAAKRRKLGCGPAPAALPSLPRARARRVASEATLAGRSRWQDCAASPAVAPDASGFAVPLRAGPMAAVFE